MPPDRLALLLGHFSVSADAFYAGPLCGISDFPARATGQLHLVRAGSLTLVHRGHGEHVVDEPSLLFYPRPMAHRFVPRPGPTADVACANLSFQGPCGNPLAEALPPFVCLPLRHLPGCDGVLEFLFHEALSDRCGRQYLLNRLFEVILVQVLRHLIDQGSASVGLMAGLSDRHLARAIVAIHERPEQAWTLEALAAEAGQSRSAFARQFRDKVGCTPGAYLAMWRIRLAQQQLLQGRPLKSIAARVGYGGEAALSRAFSAVAGLPPRAWRKQQSTEAQAVIGDD